MALRKHSGTLKSSKRAFIKKRRAKRKHIVSFQGKHRTVHLKSSEGTFGARGFAFVARYMDPTGRIVLADLGNSFGMTKGQLAETIGIRPATLQRTERVIAPKTQSRVREMLEIIGRVADWAGGEQQAMAWYRAEPLPAFGGRTAEALVKEGKATAVRDYLDHIALGGFA